MTRRVSILLLTTICLNIPGILQSSPLMSMQDLSPLAQMLHIPRNLAIDGQTPGHWRVGYSLQIANNCTWKTTKDETVYFDGETMRSSADIQYWIAPRVTIGIHIPYVRHSGGITDAFIHRFHTIFGFPQGRRNSLRSNQSEYRYERNGAPVFHLNRSVQGLGDITLAGAYVLKANSDWRVAGQMTLELPTGRSKSLIGNGYTDVSAALLGQREITWIPGTQFNLTGTAGVLFPGRITAMPIALTEVVYFGDLGGILLLGGKYVIETQVGFHSPLLRSDVDQLGLISVQWGVGGGMQWRNGTNVIAGISEDLAISTASDIVFRIAISHSF